MLLGRPPFETTNLKETYRCIREARYSLPSSLSAQAKQLITNLLAKTPEERPNLDHILRHDFFTQVSHLHRHRRPLWLSLPLLRLALQIGVVQPLPPGPTGCTLTGFLLSRRASVRSVCPPAVVTRPLISTSPVPPRASSRRPPLHFSVEDERRSNTTRH